MRRSVWLLMCVVVLPVTRCDSMTSAPVIWDHQHDQHVLNHHQDQQQRQPQCTDIPSNMSLCRDIGYSRMRLPNLLGHESLSEVLQQSRYWVPLLNLACSADTQLFLCSLFTPICLHHSIQPCRSLCEQVRDSCTDNMQQYGYPWPQMLRCEKFPQDNDLCIKTQSNRKPAEQINQVSENGGPIIIQEPPSDMCLACNQPHTTSNILENFCQADVVFRAEVRRILPKKLRLSAGTKLKILRRSLPAGFERRRLRRPSVRWNRSEQQQQQQQEAGVRSADGCCSWLHEGDGRQYLMMARVNKRNHLVPTFIAPWKLPREVRHIRKQLKNYNCSSTETARSSSHPLSIDHVREGQARGVENARGAGNSVRRNGRGRAGKRRRGGRNNTRRRQKSE